MTSDTKAVLVSTAALRTGMGGTAIRRVMALRHGLAGKIAQLVAGIAGAQMIGIVAASALTRLYSPAAFGAFGVFVSLVGVGAVFASFRFERALVVSRSRSERHGLAVLLVVTTTASGLLAYGAALLVARSGLVHGTLLDVLTTAPLFLALALTGTGLETSFEYLGLKEQAYRAIALLRLFQASVLAGTQILLGVLWKGESHGLFMGTLASLASTMLWLGTVMVRRGWLDFRAYPASLRRTWVAFRRNTEYPKYMAASSLLNSAAPQIPVLLIGSMVAPAAAGQFFLAQRIVRGPMNWVSNGVSDANFQDASEISAERQREVYLRRAGRLARFGVAPFAGLFFFAPTLFAFVFGAGWREAGIVTQLLLPGLFLQWVFTPFTPLFVVTGRQRLHLWWAVFRIALVAVLVYGGIRVAAGRGAAVGFSAAVGVSFLVQHMLLLRVLHQHGRAPAPAEASA